MNGERGGSVHSFERATVLQGEAKPEWVRRVKVRIKDLLLERGELHADDLRSLEIPPEHKNVIGNAIGAAVRAGLMVEVGRRASVAPERHGAKSSVYEITAKGRSDLAGVAVVNTPPSQQTVGGSDPGVTDGTVPEGAARGDDQATPAVPTLFPVDDLPVRPSYLDEEAA